MMSGCLWLIREDFPEGFEFELAGAEGQIHFAEPHQRAISNFDCVVHPVGGKSDVQRRQRRSSVARIQEDGFAMGQACIRFRYFRYPAPMLWRAGPGSTLHVENCARQAKPC